jgi:O-antigen biosynthesis protein
MGSKDSYLTDLSSLLDALVLPVWMKPSAWHTHIPFAMYITLQARPRVLVELGAYYGASYCAFCEAALVGKLDSKFYAIDTWEGDEHGGFYGDEVYRDLAQFHDDRYGHFSTLIRSTFTDSLPYFEDETIDLLHIDGYHTYEDTKENFMGWLPKMSDSGIILFHDIAVKRDNFGVWRLWSELSREYPSFYFDHGHGLGVLFVGSVYPGQTEALFNANNTDAKALRQYFSYIGRRWKVEFEKNYVQQKFTESKARVEEYRVQIAQLKATLGDHRKEVEQSAARLQERQQEITRLETALAQREEDAKQSTARLQEIVRLEAALDHYQEQIEQATIRLQQQRQEIVQLEAVLQHHQAERAFLRKDLRNRLMSQKVSYTRLTAHARNHEKDLEHLHNEVAISSQNVAYLRDLLTSVQRRTLNDRINSLLRTVPVFRRLYRRRAAKIIRESNLFDSSWYLGQYSDVKTSGVDPIWHYLWHGAYEKRNPSSKFDTRFYLENNPDVLISGINPLLHYIRFGQQEGRATLPVRKVLPSKAQSSVDDSQHGAATVEKEQPRSKKGGTKASKKRPYTTYSEYIHYSLHDMDAISTPFTEEDYRVLGVMERRKELLTQQYSEYPQDELITVIMPTYNRAGIITDSIDSVLAQSYSNLELIIVDDNSSDHTDDIIGTYDDERIRYLKRDENGGHGLARNDALQIAQGNWIAQIDSDDLWDPNFLLIMRNALRENPTFRFAYSAQILWKEPPNLNQDGSYSDEEEKKIRNIRFKGVFSRSYLENDNYISMISIMYHRSLVEDHGAFTTKTRRLIDWEVVLRYTEEQPALPVPLLLSHYRLNAASNRVTKTEDREHALTIIDETIHRTRLLDDLGYYPHPDLYNVPISALNNAPRPIRKSIPVSIIIPSYEAVEYLRICIESIRAYTSNYEIVIVDNKSSSGVQEYLDTLESDDDVLVIRSDQNLGFTNATNTGIQAIRFEDSNIVLLNNDAMVTPGWIEALQEVVEQDPTVGVVAPRQTLLPNSSTIKPHQPRANVQRETDINLSLHHDNILNYEYDKEKGFIELAFAPFFCVYITRETLNEAGLLDARRGPHYRSDRLYCDVVRNHCHRRIVYTPYSKIYHFHQQATQALQNRDPELYQAMKVKNNWDAIRMIEKKKQ